MKKTVIIVTIAIAMIWAQGIAQGPGEGRGMQHRPTFETFDLNHDGKIVQEEFYQAQAARMSRRAEEGRQMKNAGNAATFEHLDLDGDKAVTPEEFAAFRAKRHRGRGSQNAE